jgi:hypothetical protein
VAVTDQPKTDQPRTDESTAGTATPAQMAGGPTPASVGRAGKPRAQRGRRESGGEHDRGLRELVGSGPSQVGVTRAMRARDLNRPTEDDLAEAADVVIVRRHWQPKN